MKMIHGGDIYRNDVIMDFSVNVNPMGIPKEVEDALYNAVQNCDKYPDIYAEKLTNAVSEMLNVSKEKIVFGNGASELFMAIVHALKPKKIVIPVPSFYGYEYAANASGGEIVYFETKQDDDYTLNEDIMSVLTEDVDMLFIANPNNPTGSLMSKGFLYKLLKHCYDKNIYVVLDECFIDFCGEEYSMVREIEQFPNLVIVRAFTKVFSIPGVRLGYLVCSDMDLKEKIKTHLPEWNISIFAQAAGCECAKLKEYVKNTICCVKNERDYMQEQFKSLGIKSFKSDANFILIYSDKPLYEELLKRGILIRGCENFRGLSKGYYRVAVRKREENEIIIGMIEDIIVNA